MKTMVTLLSIGVCFLANAQTAGVYKSEGTAACTTLTLLPDHSFCYKETCEPSPRLSFGEWSVKKDVVQLQPVAPQSFTVIKRIESSKLAGDSIWLTIFDKEGANMSAILSVGLEMSGRGSYLFSNDASGAKKFVYKRSGGKIVFRTLNKLFNQRLELSTDSANSFVLTLNIPASYIFSTHADWNNSTPLRFAQKGDALIPANAPTQKLLRQKQTP